MKTKKLNLNDLKVESFVTSLESKDAQTVKGGTGTIVPAITISFIFSGSAVVIIAEEIEFVTREVRAEGEQQQKSKAETNKN